MTNIDTPTDGTPYSRRLKTPEGVELDIELANISERLTALIIDLLVIVGVLVACFVMIIAIELFDVNGIYMASAGLLVFFLTKTFYFIYFELRWRGRTPGKKAVGIRVVDNTGVALKAPAIFARNLMREIEVFLPITLLFGFITSVGTDISQWFFILWIGVFIALPFMHKNRMRAGDMIGGTWVVRTPKLSLLPDMVTSKDAVTSDDTAEDEPFGNLRFTESQLDVYGIYELQTLENLLRQTHMESASARDKVYESITKKIGWTQIEGEAISSKTFLQAFYVALREHLEGKMVLGERRANKHHKSQRAKP